MLLCYGNGVLQVSVPTSPVQVFLLEYCTWSSTIIKPWKFLAKYLTFDNLNITSSIRIQEWGKRNGVLQVLRTHFMLEWTEVGQFTNQLTEG